MAITVEELIVKVTGDTKDLKAAMGETSLLTKTADQDTTASTSNMSKAWGLMGKAAVVGTGAVALGAVKAVGDASDLKEAINKASVTYGKFASDVPGFSGSVASSLGMSRAAALDNAAGLAAMTQAMGQSKGESAQMSARLLKLSADLASFHNGDPTDMLDRLRAGLSGESEPLKKFGILVSDARVKQEAMRLGLKAHNGELTDSQKLQARYSLILKDSAIVTDDFKNTSGGLANQQRILKAKVTDLSASLGTALIPAAQTVVGLFVALVNWGQQNTGIVKLLAGSVAALGTTILIVVGVTKAWAAATTLLNAVMAANPFVLVAALIAGLVVAFVIAYRESETFRDIVNGVWTAVTSAVTTFANFFRVTLPNAFQAVKNWVSSNWPIIATIISGPFAPLVALATNAFGIRSALTGAFGAIVTMVTGKMGEVIGAIKSLWDDARSAGTTLAQNIWNGIQAGLGKLSGLAGELWSKISGAISTTASTAAAGAAALGRAIVDGIISGLASLPGRLASALLSPVQAAYDKARGLLRINSPSKLFAEGIGAPIIEGIEYGMKAEASKGGLDAALKNAIPGASTTPTVPVAIQGSGGPGAGGAGALAATPIQITVTGNTMLANSYEVAERLARILQPHLGRIVTTT